MADEPLTPTPATTPPVEDVEKLKKAHDEMGHKVRTMERELAAAKATADQLQTASNEANSVKLELLKTKLAYDAGLPARLLTLVSGTTEEEIKAKIELIRTEFGAAPVATPTPGDPTPAPVSQPQIPTPPTPSPEPGESWIDRYRKADPIKRQEMDDEARRKGTKIY